MSEPANNPLKLFYCYAHEDKALRDIFDRHLSIFKHQKLLKIWYDGEIRPGIEWEQEIDKHLSIADIILLLVHETRRPDPCLNVLHVMRQFSFHQPV